MGLLTVVEDRPTPSAVYNWKVYTCAAIASFASCMIGYDSAFIGTTLALDSFAEEFQFAQMSDEHLALVKANIVSVYQAGAFFGSFFAYGSSYYLGRKWSLWIFSLVFVLGAGLMCGQRGPDLGLIYGGRVLAGFGVGACSMIVPVYISELAPPAVRGRLVGIYELGWQTGGLVGFWINYGVDTTLAPSHTQWLIPFAVQLIPGGLLFLGAFFLPESPRWLLLKGRREEASRNLCWVRNLPPDDIYIVEEIAFIDAAIEEQQATIGTGFWKPFIAVKNSRSTQWRFFLGAMLFLFQNGSGINAVNYYSPTFFSTLNVPTFLATGIFGVVKTVLTFVWLGVLIDQLGRRKLLMFGAFGGSVCFWIIGAYLKAANIPTNGSKSGSHELTSGGIAAIFFFYLWTAFYTPSWNGTPWVINAEMFDQNTRSLGQASAAANNWFWNFIISRFTPQMFLAMEYGVYFFFASLMILSIIFVWFLVPETKALPLEAMDRLFEIKPVHSANKILLKELREQDEQFRHDADGAGLTTAKTHLSEKQGHVEKVV